MRTRELRRVPTSRAALRGPGGLGFGLVFGLLTSGLGGGCNVDCSGTDCRVSACEAGCRLDCDGARDCENGCTDPARAGQADPT